MNIDELLKVMTQLRDPQQGCPWDREQTFATIAPYTLEEAYEVADAIAREDVVELRDELGDLLFQVVFHAQMAREAGHFDFNDVVRAIVEKMVRRHPHVFGDEQVADADEQTRRWEAQKASERAARAGSGQPASVLDGVAVNLPALTRAEKLQKRAARTGFDWPDVQGPLDKVTEELVEVRAELASGAVQARVAEEIGDLLFAVVNLARHSGVEPEGALRQANLKFERRFHGVEAALRTAGKSPREVSLAELDALWDEVKRQHG